MNLSCERPSVPASTIVDSGPRSATIGDGFNRPKNGGRAPPRGEQQAAAKRAIDPQARTEGALRFVTKAGSAGVAAILANDRRRHPGRMKNGPEFNRGQEGGVLYLV